MTKLIRIVLAFLGVNVLVTILCVELQAASAPRKFVIRHAAMNARVAPLWVAEDLGFFAKQGVSVQRFGRFYVRRICSARQLLICVS